MIKRVLRLVIIIGSEVDIGMFIGIDVTTNINVRSHINVNVHVSSNMWIQINTTNILNNVEVIEVDHMCILFICGASGRMRTTTTTATIMCCSHCYYQTAYHDSDHDQFHVYDCKCDYDYYYA